MLEKEFKYYKEHQEELVAKYNGKFVVIRDEKVVGVYDSEIDALVESQKFMPLGTFLIQHVLPGSEGYTQTYHSRVTFAQGTI